MAKKATRKAGSRKAPRAKVIAGPDERAVLEVPAPAPLSAVIGQQRAVARLEEAMASGRLHHAWIFHGPEGVGKFTTALAWAALLLDPTTAERVLGQIQTQVQKTPFSFLQRAESDNVDWRSGETYRGAFPY